MRRRLLSFSVCLFAVIYVHAQSAPSNIISPAGGFSKSDDYSLEWTVGETIASTYLSINDIYTQGFNQSFIVVGKTLKTSGSTSCKVVAAPNPVNTILTVYIESTTSSTYSVTITDLSGLRVFQKYPNLKSQNLSINMHPLAAGTYVLNVYDAKNNVINATKIIKF